MINYEDMIKRVITFRDLRGYSITDMSDKTGIKEDRYKRLENGRGKLRTEEFVAICNALDIPLSFVMIDERLPFYKLDAELQLFLYDEFRKMTNEQVKLLFQSVDEYAQAKSDEEKNLIIERFKKSI